MGKGDNEVFGGETKCDVALRVAPFDNALKVVIASNKLLLDPAPHDRLETFLVGEVLVDPLMELLQSLADDGARILCQNLAQRVFVVRDLVPDLLILSRLEKLVNPFKELEKLLPSVGSISGMQVKDYLQALQDDNQILVEKIGSGNWYWCFTSDAKKLKENIINTLKAEESKLAASIAETECQIAEEMAQRKDDSEMLGGNGMDRKALLEAHDILVKEAEFLDKKLASYSETDPAEIQRKMEEIENLKASAIRWTDNIEALESMVSDLTKDRNKTCEVMQDACGDEYVPGEGLKEL